MKSTEHATERTRGRAARGAERREEILHAAMALIAERGYRATSFGAVAEQVGITQQGALHYFPTKQALLLAVLEARDRWDTAGGGERAGDPWPLDLYTSLVDYNESRPEIVRTFCALLGESVTGTHPAGEFFAERYARVREDLAVALRFEFGDRMPNGLSPEDVAPLVVAVMDGMQFQWLAARDSVDMSTAFRSLLALLRSAE